MENTIIINEELMASKSRRFLAFAIDYLFIQSLYFSYVYFIENTTFWDYLDKDFDIFDVLTGCVIVLVYAAVVYPIFSGNLGHRIMGIKVVNFDGKSNFNKFYEGAFREFIKDICIVLIFPNLWILFDKNNQNSYDKLFKTIVIKRI
ncbi:hypothetical protein B0A58_04705 [Flavobacterium branchiophilum NBRC 15030 = ATCC 35035]|uniref:Putative RDD family membrane protein YckC n=1 Tax=Flavobacterium branchiophilum TaxID=55197 RepID=A0A543G5B8_9FLAO|nr:RDD family protein [Flavobacterium branchiophilum]OXA78045.1 hypothetical protein B0A58_04705 [Flavobacterium branchiophilum NBRC 15030 = ATCC 35035]TQM41280.1 putative RDD family membrane protein YckC [Flavobacterium branchiophilum]